MPTADGSHGGGNLPAGQGACGRASHPAIGNSHNAQSRLCVLRQPPADDLGREIERTAAARTKVLAAENPRQAKACARARNVTTTTRPCIMWPPCYRLYICHRRYQHAPSQTFHHVILTYAEIWPLGAEHVRKVTSMRNILIITIALALAGCANGRDNRVLGGALIGGGSGALIGGLVGGTAGAAVAGGLIGAAAGALIADATRPGWCYYWRHHRRHYVRCR